MEQGDSKIGIRKFFYGTCILITGGSGFLGKVLIEKLLRACEVERIFMLVREKKGKTPQERVSDIFQIPLFDKLRNQEHDFMRRITCIPGDIELPDWGLAAEDKEFLLQKTNIIFHCAATVKFDDKLRRAAQINVISAKILIGFAKQMANLKAFVHVSTAYSNANRIEIDEIFYAPPISANKLLKILDVFDDDEITRMLPILLSGYPNTYTFTKSIAESLVVEEAKALPVAIFRPAIVASTYKDPIPGWVDNTNGPIGLSTSVGLGLLHVMHGNSQMPIQLIPVDYVINAMLACATQTSKFNIKFYNYISSNERPMKQAEFADLLVEGNKKFCSKYQVWHASFVFYKAKWLFTLHHFLYNMFPSYLVDAYMFLVGRKSFMRAKMMKINKGVSALVHFSMIWYEFKNDNIVALYSGLEEDEKKLFQFSMKNLNWKEYIIGYMRGIRLYIIHDPIETLPYAMKRQKILDAIYYMILIVICVVVFVSISFIINVLL